MKRLRLVFMVFAIGTCVGRAATQTPPQAVFRTGVSVVRLDVLVTAGGHPIIGLGPQDFEVLDNGVPQRVDVATTGGGANVALVLDTSGSVEGQPLEQLVAACQSVVNALLPEDRLTLVTFSSRVSLEAKAVHDPLAVRSIVVNARAGGRTALWDALFASLSLVGGGSERSLVLLFTDGVDNSSWLTRDQAAQSLKRADTVVYAVKSRLAPGVGGTPGPVGSSPDQTAERVLIERREREKKAWSDLGEVVKPSGGDVLEADSPAKLPAQFGAILREFRSRYLVTYEPSGVRRDDGWHPVEVRVKGQKAKVVTRAGYYATRAPTK